MFRVMKNIMSELNEMEQEKLLLLAEEYSERELVKELAKPKPEGLGVETSRATIGRLLRELRAKRVFDQGEETKKQAKAIREQHGESGADLEEGALAVLRQRFFEEATKTMKTTDVATMYRSLRELICKERRIALSTERARISREYLELARERFEFSAAKVALEHADELQAIIADEETDDAEKIERARERLFGKNPAEELKGRAA